MTDATSTTVSGVIDENRVHELPLNGRHLHAVRGDAWCYVGQRYTARAWVFGQWIPGVLFQLFARWSGQHNVMTTYPATLLSPDAIQEYRLAASNFSAEYGRGAFVANVVSRAGGNRWHAQLFEFLINDKLDAAAFQDNASSRPKPPFKESQFGFTLGGPIRKDRIFLFAAMEGLESRSTARRTLPVAIGVLHLKRDRADCKKPFSAIPRASTGPGDGPRRHRIQAFWPRRPSLRVLRLPLRADFELRPDRDSLFVRFASFDQNQTSLVSPYVGLDEPFVIATRSLGAGYVHRFGASRVNERSSMERRSQRACAAGGGPGAVAEWPDRTVLPGTPDAVSEQSYTENVFHAVDNFSLLLSRHHLVIGGDFQSRGQP